MQYTTDNTLIASLLIQPQHLFFPLCGKTRAQLLNSSSKPLGTRQYSLEMWMRAHTSGALTEAMWGVDKLAKLGSQQTASIATDAQPRDCEITRCPRQVPHAWSLSRGTSPPLWEPSSRQVPQLQRAPADPLSAQLLATNPHCLNPLALPSPSTNTAGFGLSSINKDTNVKVTGLTAIIKAALGERKHPLPCLRS